MHYILPNYIKGSWKLTVKVDCFGNKLRSFLLEDKWSVNFWNRLFQNSHNSKICAIISNSSTDFTVMTVTITMMLINGNWRHKFITFSLLKCIYCIWYVCHSALRKL